MPPKYGLVWPSTSILGSWNSHWKYVELKMKMMKDGHELQETVDIWFQWFVFKFISLLSKASNHKHASRPALCTLRFHLCEKYAVQLRAAGSSWFITGGMNIHTYPYSKFRILPRVYSSGVYDSSSQAKWSIFQKLYFLEQLLEGFSYRENIIHMGNAYGFNHSKNVELLVRQEMVSLLSKGNEGRHYHTIPTFFYAFLACMKKTYQVVLIAGEAQLPGSHRGFEVLGLHNAMLLETNISAFQVSSKWKYTVYICIFIYIYTYSVFTLWRSASAPKAVREGLRRSASPEAILAVPKQF